MDWLTHNIAVIAVIILVYLIRRYGPHAYQPYSDRTLLNSYLQQAGVWAPAAFVLLTAAQVIAAPIPAMALGVAGGFIFGLVPGFLLSLMGLFIGSMLAFALAKWFGRPLVQRLIGEETYAKFEPLMRGKGLMVLIVLFLLPFMPDDALCFLAALTPMRARAFALLVLFCRTPGILVSSLTGAGVIALPWYGWALVGLASLILLYFSWRHSKTLEGWLSRFA
jgi:uncharacterized membrane protein YdjX (TVP38/TMEM64 family)